MTKLPLAVACCALMPAGILAQTSTPPTMEEMWQIIQDQQKQIEDLKAQTEESETIAITAIEAVESSVSAPSNRWYDRVSIGGYAEHHLNITEGSSDQIDAHRYVLFVSNQFTDNIRFFSELEVEHSFAADGAPGAVELEQALIEWQYSDNHRLTLGQYLIPVGILNETHEPDTFYGVERNVVETEVIPSTWWETGAMLSGEIAPGFTYDAGIHSGLFVENFRIRSGRQRSAEAVADDFAFTGRLSYNAIPGLQLAATLNYQTDITQSTFEDDAPALLTQVQAIYQNDNFSLRALYAGWDIDNDAFEANGSDTPSGWFVEPSYKFTDNLGVFARYAEVDPSRGDRPDERTERLDIGLNYWMHPNVVLKADLQESLEDGSDAFNLGIGWSF